MFSWLDLLGVLEDKYSLSLRPTLWLSDVGPVLLSSTEGLEITIATERERRVSKTGAVANAHSTCQERITTDHALL